MSPPPPLRCALRVAVSGEQLLVGDSFSGMRVYDLSDPANPVEAGVYDSPGVAWGVRPVGDLVYLGDGVCGMSILKRGA